MKKKYFLGLDIGTNSVGWCLTDENYKIIKKGGKSLWGARLFSEAQSAEKRRGYKTARRNNNRKKGRIDLLQAIFAEEMHKTDPTFFQRLDESFYHPEDRSSKNKFRLFLNGEKDSKYYKKFPTIYHLRKHLIDSKEKEDIRYIYLAISHMMKKRGHFLNGKADFEVTNKDELFENYSSLKTQLELFFENVEFEGVSNVSIDIDKSKHDEIEKIYYVTKGKNEQKKALDKLINPDKNKIIKDIIVPFLLGSEINIKKVKDFDLDEDIKISTLMEDFDGKIEECKSLVGNEEFFDALVAGKMIFDFYYLAKMLKNSNSLSDAMIAKYNEYKLDLEMLKRFTGRYTSKYVECFRSNVVPDNYVNYNGMNREIGSKAARSGKTSLEKFYSYIRKNIFTGFVENEESLKLKADIEARMESKDFLKKLGSTDNRLLPYQLNLSELRAILDKQAKHHDFLRVVDEEGFLTTAKIESLLTFKIPYYIGPLNNKSDKAWIVRTNEKIYPWNFTKIVDEEASAKNFILRMLNKCTYLRDCYCLPKNSLIFSKYNVLAVLNKININGMPIEKKDKDNIITKLFMEKRKVTKKNIVDYFKSVHGSEVTVRTSTEKELEEVNCDMASYVDFARIFPEEGFIEKHEATIEKLISDIVIFEDKDILEKRINSESEYEIFREKIREIKGLTYKGYARVSRELLTGLRSTGDARGYTIMDLMSETHYNLQELVLTDTFGFGKLIEEYNKNNSTDYSNVEKYIDEEIYTSPVMKRSLLQAYKIIEELEKIIGSKIDEYYVECTRVKNKKDKKKRSKTRQETIQALLEGAQKAIEDKFSMVGKHEINNLLEKCKSMNMNELQSDVYFLYFAQLGRCMYSMEPIDFDSLSLSYDIDHIIPQSLFKDDSLENRVLVKKDLNSLKSDIYPIPGNVLHEKAPAFFKMLKEMGLMGNRKYDSLSRKVLSEADINRFINRQIVVTNQAVSGLIKVLTGYKNVDPKKIIYSKGEIVSDFRHTCDIYKSRKANNFHHAHDAYLNIIVGRVVHKYFERYRLFDSKDLALFKEHKQTTNPMKIFFPKVKSENGYVSKYWNESLIADIKKNIFTRFDIMTTVRAYVGNEMIPKVTIYPSKLKNADAPSNIPVKSNDAILSNTDRYGGFNSHGFSHYTLLETIDKKGKQVFVMEAIPRMFLGRESEYLSNACGYDSGCKVIIDRLKINTIFELEHRKFCVTGKTNLQFCVNNMKERFFTEKAIKTIRLVEKYVKKITEKQRIVLNDSNEVVIVVPRTDRNKTELITHRMLDELLAEIIFTLGRKEFGFSNIVSLLSNIKDVSLTDYDIERKAKIAYEMLSLVPANTKSIADLTSVGLAKSSGVLMISKIITPGTKIVFESITGFYRKVVWECK